MISVIGAVSRSSGVILRHVVERLFIILSPNIAKKVAYSSPVSGLARTSINSASLPAFVISVNAFLQVLQFFNPYILIIIFILLPFGDIVK